MVVFELALRMTGQMPFYYYPKGLFIADKELGYRLNPGFKALQSLGEYTYHIAINTDGLRDVQHGEKKGYRILGLGDSFTFGTGLELDDTYLSIMERSLNTNVASSTPIEIVKAGVPGYGTDQELTYLKTKGMSYKPDMVVVGFCVPNDPDDSIQEKDTVVDGFLVSQKSAAIVKINPLFEIKAFLRKNVYAYSFIINRLKASPITRKAISDSKLGKNVFEKELQFYRKDYSEHTKEAWEQTYGLIRDLKRLTEGNSIAFSIVLIPTRMQVDDRQRDAVMRQFGIRPEDCDVSKPTRIISSFLESEGINYIDLTGFIKERISGGRNLYFILDGHWNAEGASTAGNAIASHILKSGLLKSTNAGVFKYADQG